MILPVLLIAGLARTALAVEGGSGAYLLGSRDSLAGIVPPPGTYVTNDFVFISGKTAALSIGGAVLGNASLDVFLYKANITHAFKTPLLGGTPALTLTVPVATGKLEASGEVNGTSFAGTLTDKKTGLGDLALTPSLGWHQGPLHYSAAMSIFLPTGLYDTASIDIADRDIDVLNYGKNRVGFDPTFAITHLNPENGREFSGAAGLTFSLENQDTDYQTAPELHLETAALQHLPNGLALGAIGYYYQQLADDSGDGADSFKAALDAESLRARVFGIGPILTYSGKLGGYSVSAKGKYIHEFEAKRRFESDVLWFTLGVSF
jgi:hypothetical protein